MRNFVLGALIMIGFFVACVIKNINSVVESPVYKVIPPTMMIGEE